MQVHNFLRNAIPDLEKFILPSWSMQSPLTVKAMREILETAKNDSTQKFILPNTGRILDDGLKAAPEILRLPFPCVVIEYTSVTDSVGPSEKAFGREGTSSAPKRIIVAQEVEEQIVVFSIVQYQLEDKPPYWFFFPYCAVIPINNPNKEFKVTTVGQDPAFVERMLPDWRERASVDLVDEARTVMEFLEALSCSNVGFSDYLSSQKKSGKTNKKNLCFDSYRVLSLKPSTELKKKENNNIIHIDNRLSPREHLRRGHVRHYASGLKIWINNMIINAGAGNKVSKIYKVG